MASPFSMKLCKRCKEEKKETKARALCFECHDLLCEECSERHLKSKPHKGHNLIDLVPFLATSKSEQHPSELKSTLTTLDEDQLSSDFLEHVTLTENTILYRGAQVAVEYPTVMPEPEKNISPKQVYRGSWRATKCLEFSVKRPDDREKVNVKGVLCLSNTIVVVDSDNKLLKLFDHNGAYLSSTELNNYINGITFVRDRTFATCDWGNDIYLWTVHGQKVVKKDLPYHMNQSADGICYNGTYYCVLHHYDSAITIMDGQGEQVRIINMQKAFGKTFELGYDIHMDSHTNNIYVPCDDEDGVLCMTIEGQPLWFTPLSGRPRGITEIQGTLCVADLGSICLHEITKEGEYVRKVSDKEVLGGRPFYVFCGQNCKLYVSYEFSDVSCDVISVYSLTE